MNNGAMLNAYPDSMGGRLSDIIEILRLPEFENAFRSFYILPSLFHSDLDRGFSVIDYGLDEKYASPEDLEGLKELGIDLKLDFVLNHLSVQSPQFADILKKGRDSEYRDFFIDWNKFWQGRGEMTDEGYIRPDAELIKDMFFRKAGLPILMVEFPDGSLVPYWNTFYQEVRTDGDGKRSYLGQMDLNIDSPKVKEYYRDTLNRLADYGAELIRLDAFAYAAKAPGRRNFFNEPETWELLSELQETADRRGLTLLPEIHASYGEKTYEKMAAKGYPIYDFFLPGLIIDAFERKSGELIANWGEEIVRKGMTTVNMLGCHDGIPLLDLKGLLSEDEIQRLIGTVVSRGGRVKDLHGAKNVYYQVNATYYSALGEDDRRLLIARAVQLFMPGKPQIWYLDLFAGKNDYEAVERAGAGGHKEINRTNLSREAVDEALQRNVVRKQLELLRLRNTCPAFGEGGETSFACVGSRLIISRTNGGHTAVLTADFDTLEYEITTGEN